MGRHVQEFTRDLWPDPVTFDEFFDRLFNRVEEVTRYHRAKLEGKEYPEDWIRILEEIIGIQHI